MNSELRDALRRLCSSAGWSYGVLWRVDPCNPRLLVMETNYCEEKFRALVAKMVDEVHLVGEGTIGEVAASGKHRWIHSDGNTVKWTRSGTGVDRDLSQAMDKTELCHQFLSGIKSMVFISLPSQVVVQFGSSQQMFEDLGFIDQVKSSFLQLNGIKGPSLLEDAQNDAKLHMPHDELETAVSSGDFYSWCRNINSMYGSHNKKLIKNVQSSRGRLKSLFSEEFYSSARSTNGLQHPNVVAMSSALSVAYATQRFSDDGVLASHYSHMTAHNHCNRDSHNQNGILDTVNASSEICKTNSYGPKKLCSFQHASSSCHITESDLLTNNGFIRTISFGPEQLESMQSVQRDSPLDVSTLVCSKDDNQGENSLIDQQLEQISERHAPLAQGNKPEVLLTSYVSSDINTCGLITQLSSVAANSSAESASNFFSAEHNGAENPLNTVTALLTDNDFFDTMELDLNPSIFGQDSWDDIMIPINKVGEMNMSTSYSERISDWNMSFKADIGDHVFSESGLEQLLDAVVCGNHNLASSHGSVDPKINHIANSHSENWCSTSENVVGAQPYRHEVPSVGLPCFSQTSDLLLSGCCFGNKHGSLKEAELKSRHTACTDDNSSVNAASSMIHQPKMSEEAAKVVRKRARPGESTRPRPKDRQQIQDRVRELRELVPNGAKCSIDALLDRTIKHMLYLQGVTKYADKLKQADEPKVICEENSVVLRDTTGSNGNGATWAFEIAGRTMVCPIIVEDLSPPGQMLVEMLCEECGFFLEIADVIRGFGLTILKGVMEVRNTKIWARFFVEANRNVTRIDIFLSLVQLLQQAASGTRAIDQINEVINSKARDLTNYQQSHMAIPISLGNKLQ